MSDVDYDKLAGMVADKLGATHRPARDDAFIKKLVAEMIEHRSPCHDLTDKEIDTIKNVVKNYRKVDKGVTFIVWGLLLYILKNCYDLLALNLKWRE